MAVLVGGMCNEVEKIEDVLVKDSTIEVVIKDYMSCNDCDIVNESMVYFLSVDKDVSDDNYVVTYIYNTTYADKCEHG